MPWNFGMLNVLYPMSRSWRVRKMHGGHFLPFALAASSAEPRPSDFRCPCHRINWVWALPWMWHHEIFIKIALLTYHGFNVSRPQTILWSLFIINIITITHSPHSPVLGNFNPRVRETHCVLRRLCCKHITCPGQGTAHFFLWGWVTSEWKLDHWESVIKKENLDDGSDW